MVKRRATATALLMSYCNVKVDGTSEMNGLPSWVMFTRMSGMCTGYRRWRRRYGDEGSNDNADEELTKIKNSSSAGKLWKDSAGSVKGMARTGCVHQTPVASDRADTRSPMTHVTVEEEEDSGTHISVLPKWTRGCATIVKDVEYAVVGMCIFVKRKER